MVIASGATGFDVAAGFASNGYGEHSPGGYTMMAPLMAEVVLTFMFLIIILVQPIAALRRDSLLSRSAWASR